jgi:hypothetical protein
VKFLFAIVIAENRSAQCQSNTANQNTKTNGITTLTMFTHQRDQRSIGTPDDIFDRGAIHLGDSFLLLDIVKDNRGGGTEYETSCTTVEYLIRLHGGFDGFDD